MKDVTVYGEGCEGSHTPSERLLVCIVKGDTRMHMCPCAIQRKNVDMIWSDMVVAGLMLADPGWVRCLRSAADASML